ncbi:hypothetical protein Pelo_15796 [Pelomyxa schiedti]|nr:hypothetical protein Pelo_15796 [Pelomyxa schiedti]
MHQPRPPPDNAPTPLLQQNQQLMQLVQQLRQQNQQQAAEIANTKSKLAAEEARALELEKLMEPAMRAWGLCKQKLEKDTKDFQTKLREQEMNFRSIISTLESQLSSVRSHEEALKTKNEQLTAQLSQISAERDNLQKTVESLSSQVIKLETDVCRYKRECNPRADEARVGKPTSQNIDNVLLTKSSTQSVNLQASTLALFPKATSPPQDNSFSISAPTLSTSAFPSASPTPNYSFPPTPTASPTKVNSLLLTPKSPSGTVNIKDTTFPGAEVTKSSPKSTPEYSPTPPSPPAPPPPPPPPPHVAPAPFLHPPESPVILSTTSTPTKPASAAVPDTADEDTKREGCTKTPAQLRHLLGLLIKDSDQIPQTPDNQQHCITLFMEKFAKNFSALENLILQYPFLVREHPQQPVTCFKKMSAWETALFAEMKPVDAANLRKAKSIEITRTAPAEVPELAKRIAALIKSKQTAQAIQKKQANTGQVFGSVLEDIRRRGQAEELKRQAAMQRTVSADEDGDI